MSATLTAARYYSPPEVAVLLGVGEHHVSRLFRRGLLPQPRRFGRYRMLTEADVEAVRGRLIEQGVIPQPGADLHGEGVPLPNKERP